MSGTHSVLSPSKGAMILRCAAALAAGKGIKDEPSQYAAEGTAYHDVSARVLDALGNGGPGYATCAAYVGATIEADGFKFIIDEDNATHAQVYVDAIRRLSGVQYYEVRLDTSAVVGVPGQGGTGDAVTLDFEASTIHVDDLKFGRGEVVFAEKNEQLLQYGAAALLKYELSHDWKFIKLGIHQPRLNHYSEHIYTVEEVRAWVKENQGRFVLAHALWEDPTKLQMSDFAPGEKQCRWCPIRGSCAARADQFLAQFPVAPPNDNAGKLAPAPAALLDDAQLARARDRVDDIEQWCADIKAEAHTRGVVLGKKLPGWKVVDGKRGNRKWDEASETTVENTLVSGLQDAAYKPRQIITPTEAEKKLKKHSALWDVLVKHITQAEGAKSLVRDDSPKQAVLVNQTEFPIQEPA